MVRILAWIKVNGATVLGVTQAAIKVLKELLTGVVNLVSLVLPKATSSKLVEQVRGILNTIDELVEKIKSYLLK